MKPMFKTLSILALTTAFAGCAGGPSKEDILEEQLKLAEKRAELLEQQKEREEVVLKEKLDDVPDWYMDPPAADPTGVYGAGMASSDDMSVAIKKARLQADFEVAQQIEQELSGLEQQFTGDSNNVSRSEYQSAVERFVAAVPMAGQEVAEQEVSVIDGKYTAYILSRLSFDRMDQMMERQNRQQVGTSEMKEAFSILRERVEASRARSSSSSSDESAPDSGSKLPSSEEESSQASDGSEMNMTQKVAEAAE